MRRVMLSIFHLRILWLELKVQTAVYLCILIYITDINITELDITIYLRQQHPGYLSHSKVQAFNDGGSVTRVVLLLVFGNTSRNQNFRKHNVYR